MIHIRDIFGGISGGMDRCLNEHLGFDIRLAEMGNGTDAGANATENNSVNETINGLDEERSFEGVHVIFIGDSVMKLVMGFFSKLVHGSFGIKVTFIETNHGIHLTMPNIRSTLQKIQQKEKDQNTKRVILFNTGLHDIDGLCSSKRESNRIKNNVTSEGQSCSDAYREAMVELVRLVYDYPAELRVFRSTTEADKRYALNVVENSDKILFALLIMLTHFFVPQSS